MSPPPDALADLTARHRPEIARYLARFLGDADEAEDVCQEVFLRAHRAFARLAPDSNSRAWLYRIATNSALNAVRGRARRVARTADVELDGIPDRDGASPERRAELRA